MHRLWFRSVFRVRGPWPKRYGYHLSIYYLLLLLLLYNLKNQKLIFCLEG